jgi:hypothetical protein
MGGAGGGSADQLLQRFHHVVEGSEIASYQRCAAAGGHPNILPLLGCCWDEESSSYWLVLQYVAKCDPRLPLSQVQAVEVGEQVSLLGA